MTGAVGVAAASKQRDWSELPGELLDPIMRRLTKVVDVICFQGVCKPWRQAVLVYDPQLQRHRPPTFRQSLPWLTIRHYYQKDRTRPKYCPSDKCRHFLDVAHENKIIRHVGPLPRAAAVVLFGAPTSPSGWQLTQEGADHQCFLVDPFTGKQILLPSIISTGFVECFAMSADPTTKECIVMILLNHGYDQRSLEFCKLIGGVEQQKQGWTSIPCYAERDPLDICSIVFWRGRFHGLCKDGKVLVCDLDGPNEQPSKPMVSWAFLPKSWNNSSDQSKGRLVHNLVVSPEGELMLVTWHSDYNYKQDFARWKVDAFIVYKINEDEQRWDEVKSIGDYALFFDESKAVFVSTADHPECRRNCVYYKLGIYDIDSTKVQLFFPDDDVYLFNDEYSWIFPSN